MSRRLALSLALRGCSSLPLLASEDGCCRVAGAK